MMAYLVSAAIVHEVLTDSNYENWKVCIKNYLRAYDLWNIVENEIKPEEENGDEREIWERKNAMALHTIQISCAPYILSQIREIPIAKRAWEFLAAKQVEQTQEEPIRSLDELHVEQSQGDSEQLEGNSERIRSLDELYVEQSDEVSEPISLLDELHVEQSQEDSEPETEMNEYDKYKPLLDAVDKANWDAAKIFLNLHPNAVRARLTSEGYTALHSAVLNGNAEIVEELVKLMTEQDLEILPYQYGWTAFHHAAMCGLKQMAACMVQKNKNLISIRDDIGSIPIVAASVNGNHDFVRYLYTLTPPEELSPEKGDNGATLLFFCITAKMFDVALDLLQQFPQLAVKVVENSFPINSSNIKISCPMFVLSGMPSVFHSGSSLLFWQRWIYSCIYVPQPTTSSNFTRIIDIPELDERQNDGGSIVSPVFGQLHRLLPNLLKVLGLKHIYDTKLMHVQARKLLELSCQQLPPLTFEQLEKCLIREAVFRAIKNGILELVMEATKANSSLRWPADISNERTVFECAVLYRQEKIFNLLYGSTEQSNYKFCLDSDGNSMLHLAGMLGPSDSLDRIPGAALQMQRELQWFKEIESFTSPTSKELRNNDDYTAYELFSKEHKNLVNQGEIWMKETAKSCTVVAALIVTIMFAAAFTIPNSGNTDFSIFSKKKSFQAFIISDSISFLSSTTSVMIFLGILTSRYGEAQFLKSLPTKMIIGLSTLFISIASMIITFCSSISLILHGQMSRIFIPVLILASVPIIIFVLLQSSLFVTIFSSTYGTSIFNRNMKCWYK